MKFTLGAIKASRLPHVLGVCSDDARLVQWVNAAQERLMARGRWWGTVVRAKFCVADGCLTWPREVALIEKVRLCGKPILAHGLWYEFTDYVDPSCCGSCSQNDPRLVAIGNAPTVAEIEVGKAVIAYATNAADVGQDIIIQGNNENNAWVRTNDGGTPLDGERIVLSLAGTVGTTEWAAGGITGIQKEATDYDVLLYQYDVATATVEQLLGRYQHDEAYPDYRRSALRNIANGCCEQEDCANPVYTVEVLATLQHVPVGVDADWFIIQNQSAIELATKAVKLEEDGKDGESEISFKKAIRELQHQLRTMTGDKLSYITTGHGTAYPSRVFSNFI